MVTAYASAQLDPTADKCWFQLNYLNGETDGGMYKPLLYDRPYFKKTGREQLGTRVEIGWLSEIECRIAENPRKIRGSRTELLIFEEFGSNPYSKTSYIQGRALVVVNGVRIGIRLAWGTGGDSDGLDGLRDIFYNPISYDVLPMRHNYSLSGETSLTGFFIPSYRILTQVSGKRGELIQMMDKRGYTPAKPAREHLEREREKFAADPNGYMIHCAEFCFVPEEALVLEGRNEFNKNLLVEQLTQIKQFKRGPQPVKGYLEYDFKGEAHIEENIQGFKWIPNNHSKLQILEHPIRDESGKAFRNLYVAGIDSIDLGQDETSEATRDPSNFCICIKRRQYGTKDPTYVALYKDRPGDIREAYRTALKLLEYYNCKAVLEASKITFRQFLQDRNKADRYLFRRPRATQTDPKSANSRQFGAPATEYVIQHQLGLIATYIEDYSHNIWFEDILDELLRYNYENKTHFDIVAAMGMTELGDEELQGFIPKPEDITKSTWVDFGWYKDINGHKRFGKLEPTHATRVKASILPLYDEREDLVRSSDPRITGYKY